MRKRNGFFKISLWCGIGQLLMSALLHSQTLNVTTFSSPNPEETGSFAYAVAGAGDVNNDGHDDVIVGAYRENTGASPTDAGRAYVFSGNDGGVLFQLQSPNEESFGQFGFAVAGAGDVNGDGHADLIVGAYRENPGTSPSDAGRAYVFSGQNGSVLLQLKSPNEESFGQFGYAVAGAGDVNGDGRDDVLVGAYREDPATSPSDAGRAYIFSGLDGSVLYALQSPNEETLGYFGFAVAGVGDVNNDGRSDVLVGAYREDPGASPSDAGRAYVFSGQNGSVLLQLKSSNEESFGQFGYAVAGAGDVNGDGRNDMIVGAPFEDPGASPDNAGRAYVFSGLNGSVLFTFQSPNEESLGQFGLAVDGAGDMNGDGSPDLVVGAYLEDPGSSPNDAGRAYVFSGQNGGLLFQLQSGNEENFGVFGFALAGVGDSNKDGCSEIVVGAYLENSGGVTDAGRAYLFGLPPAEIAVSPLSHDFGAIEIGQNNSPQSFEISNSGVCALQITDIALGGANPGQFNLVPVEPFTLTQNQSQVVIVSFAPSAAGLQTADLIINSNDADESQIIIPLQGTASSLSITATKRDSLLDDNDGDGKVDPGDKLRYRVIITNNGVGTATGVLYNSNMAVGASLVVGSVSTTLGAITAGNGSGNTSVEVNLGSLAGGGSATLSYDAVIDNPFLSGDNQIACQGTVTGDNFTTALTDDPDTAAPNDSTVTTIDASPVISALMTDVLQVDLNGNGRVEPGDRIKYTVNISNTGSQAASASLFKCGADIKTILLPTSVTTSQGTIIGGASDTVTVNLGNLPGVNGSATITFEAIINAPFPSHVAGIRCQGQVSTSESPSVLTDDPATAIAGDATVTLVCINTELVGIDNDLKTFVKLDLLSSPPTLLNLGATGTVLRGEALAYDAATDLVYMTLDSSTVSKLVSVKRKDIFTTTPVPMKVIGFLPNSEYEALALHPFTSKLYAIDGDQKRLAIIDKTTAAVTYVGPVVAIFSACESLSFSENADGVLTLYTVASNAGISRLYSIDLTTGTVSLMHPTNQMNFADIEALAGNPCPPAFGLSQAIAFNTSGGAQFVLIDLLTGLGTPFAVSGAASRDIEGLFFMPVEPDIPTPGEVKPHVLVANKVMNFSSFSTIEGKVHCNGDIVFNSSPGSTLSGEVSAKGDVTLSPGNTVNGDITAGGTVSVAAGATVNGNVIMGDSLARVPVDSLGFGPFSGASVQISPGDDITVTPGTYNVVRCSTNATIRFSSGTYDLNRLVLDAGSKLRLDVSTGAITINVDNRLLFRREAEIVMDTPGGTPAHILINFDGTGKLLFAKHSKIQGTFLAPTARVKLAFGAGFWGTICARRIDVNKTARVRHLSLPGGIPKDLAPNYSGASELPASFALHQNFPNPFAPGISLSGQQRLTGITNISFGLPEEAEVSLRIFDVLGREIAILQEGRLAAGRHSIIWNGRNQYGEQARAGVYVYRLAIHRPGAASLLLTRKLTILR